ncbi:hypothetical protein ABIC63_000539 [Pseudacidovorax sp. 1753]
MDLFDQEVYEVALRAYRRRVLTDTGCYSIWVDAESLALAPEIRAAAAKALEDLAEARRPGSVHRLLRRA